MASPKQRRVALAIAGRKRRRKKKRGKICQRLLNRSPFILLAPSCRPWGSARYASRLPYQDGFCFIARSYSTVHIRRIKLTARLACFGIHNTLWLTACYVMTCRFEVIVALAEEMPTVTFNRSWTPPLLLLLPLLLLRMDAAAEAAAEDKGSDATGSSDQGKI